MGFEEFPGKLQTGRHTEAVVGGTEVGKVTARCGLSSSASASSHVPWGPLEHEFLCSPGLLSTKPSGFFSYLGCKMPLSDKGPSGGGSSALAKAFKAAWSSSEPTILQQLGVGVTGVKELTRQRCEKQE